MTRSYQIKNRMNSATFMSDPYCIRRSTLLQLKKDKIRLYNRRSNIFDKEDKSDRSIIIELVRRFLFYKLE